MTLRTYVIGFALSVLLTLAAFVLVLQGFAQEFAVGLLIVLAVAQLLVQLICFLHVGQEEKPRWNFITLMFTALIVVILVGGTVWIMYHLNHHEMGLSELYEDGVVSPHTQHD